VENHREKTSHVFSKMFLAGPNVALPLDVGIFAEELVIWANVKMSWMCAHSPVKM
jgi:hypothetical protein